MVFSENIRKHGLRQYIEIDFIIYLLISFIVFHLYLPFSFSQAWEIF